MTNVQLEIDRIRSDALDVEELMRCLDSQLLLVRVNAILSIARRRLNDAMVIDKIAHIARQERTDRIFGTVTCDRLAAAALHWIASEESKRQYELIRQTLCEEDMDDLEHLVREGPPNLT